MQKISKDTDELNSNINQLDMTDIYRALHPGIDYTFFLSSHGRNTHQLDHILSHLTYLNKCKRIEIIQCLLPDHSGIKLEINSRKIAGKSRNVWELNNIF